MQFSSTRNPSLRVPLSEAAVAGFPRDGGLFVPALDPDLRGLTFGLGKGFSYREIASLAASALFDGDLDPVESGRIADSACSFSPLIKSLDDSVSLVDLSTGPSGSFKDFGMSFLSALLAHLPDRGERTVLLATTGDTGAAAAEAFKSSEKVRLVLLYPDGPVRGIRPELLARNGGFVEAVRVPDTLDSCRHLVRAAFERYGAELGLVPATSANVARLMAQVFYYLYAFIALRDRNPGDFLVAIPSGNLGNLISGLYAWRWGVPITGFILTGTPGVESSDALMRYLFEPLPEDGTAPYDADDPENRERIRALAAGSPDVLRTLFFPVVMEETFASEAMFRLHRDHGVFAGPAAALSWAASERVLDEHRLRGAAQVAVFADSHPSKHADALERACGVRPAPRFSASDPFPPDAELPPDLAALERYLRR
jgi:threonine synthase